VAERIRVATAADPIPIESGEIEVTISGGCAVGPAAAPDVLVHTADAQMYLAKESGRNRIIAIGPDRITPTTRTSPTPRNLARRRPDPAP